MESPAGSRRLGWLAPLTVGLLLVLTVAAFGWSQRLKREPLVIDRVEYIALGLTPNGESPTVFSPNGDCKRDRMSINFRTTRSDTADVEIIGLGGRSIRTLARNRFFKRYREHTLIWNGRKDDGSIPFTSKYRVRVTMHGEDRVLYLPGFIRLHKYAPRGDSACPGLALPQGTDQLRTSSGSPAKDDSGSPAKDGSGHPESDASASPPAEGASGLPAESAGGKAR